MKARKRKFRLVAHNRESLRAALMDLRREFRKAYSATLRKHMNSYRQMLVDKAAVSIAQDLEKERRRAEFEIRKAFEESEIAENQKLAKALADLDPDAKQRG